MKMKTEITLSPTEVARAVQAYMEAGGWEIKGPINFTTKVVDGDDEFAGCRFNVEDWEGPDLPKKSQ